MGPDALGVDDAGQGQRAAVAGRRLAVAAVLLGRAEAVGDDAVGEVRQVGRRSATRPRSRRERPAAVGGERVAGEVADAGAAAQGSLHRSGDQGRARARRMDLVAGVAGRCPAAIRAGQDGPGVDEPCAVRAGERPKGGVERDDGLNGRRPRGCQGRNGEDPCGGPRRTNLVDDAREIGERRSGRNAVDDVVGAAHDRDVRRTVREDVGRQSRKHLCRDVPVDAGVVVVGERQRQERGPARPARMRVRGPGRGDRVAQRHQADAGAAAADGRGIGRPRGQGGARVEGRRPARGVVGDSRRERRRGARCDEAERRPADRGGVDRLAEGDGRADGGGDAGRAVGRGKAGDRRRGRVGRRPAAAGQPGVGPVGVVVVGDAVGIDDEAELRPAGQVDRQGLGRAAAGHDPAVGELGRVAEDLEAQRAVGADLVVEPDLDRERRAAGQSQADVGRGVGPDALGVDDAGQGQRAAVAGRRLAVAAVLLGRAEAVGDDAVGEVRQVGRRSGRRDRACRSQGHPSDGDQQRRNHDEQGRPSRSSRTPT